MKLKEDKFQSAKKSYKEPSLRVYGNVTEITQNTTNTNGATVDGRGNSADRTH